MKKICAFDVNETLLDLSVLDPEFERIFGDWTIRKEWFGQFIQSALVTIVTDNYIPFGQIASAAFDMVAARHHVIVSEKAKKAVLGKLTQLPAHPEIVDSLKKLKDAGFTIATITNSVQEVAEKQLEYAGIRQYFDMVLTADTVHRLKPSKEAYELVAQTFNVTTADIYLIASHAWDIAGARHAGCLTAFIARPGAVVDPLAGQPDIVGKNLREVVDQIIQRDS